MTLKVNYCGSIHYKSLKFSKPYRQCKFPEVKGVSVEGQGADIHILGKGYVDAISAHEAAIKQYIPRTMIWITGILDESIFVTGIKCGICYK